jgi:hypothetical protein
VVREVRDGEFFFQMNEQYSLWFAMPKTEVLGLVEDFVIDVDARILTPNGDGAVVVVFRAQLPRTTGRIAQINDYFYVGVDADNNFFMFKQQDGVTSALVPLTPLVQGPLTPGEPIHIKLIARRENYTLYVNNVLQATGRDFSFLGGRVALAAWSRSIAPFEVAFDNFVVALPHE